MAERALLVLADGTWFEGQALGAVGHTVGELVFTTAMVGYQETLTDPSYQGLIVMMTAPHIGNTGLNDQDNESSQIWAAGCVVRSPARRWSNWQGQRSLDSGLVDHGVVGIAEVDTRAVTLHLRENGAMRAGIFSGPALADQRGRPRTVDELVEVVEAAAPLVAGAAPAAVTVEAPALVRAVGQPVATVVAVDLGMPAATPSLLAERGLTVQLMPRSVTFEQIMAVKPDGVFFGGGPGDPAAAEAEVALLRALLDAGLPFFGVGLGHQVLGRALGFETYKLPYGHHGLSQPVLDRATGRVLTTTHSHGFAVRVDSLDEVATPFDQGRYGRVRVSHLSIGDNSVEGLECLDLVASAVQFQPESPAGPREGAYLYDRFVECLS